MLYATPDPKPPKPEVIATMDTETESVLPKPEVIATMDTETESVLPNTRSAEPKEQEPELPALDKAAAESTSDRRVPSHDRRGREIPAVG